MPNMLDGHASGVESKPIIDKLVELKRIPIQRLKRRQDETLLENRALGDIKQQIKKLSNSLRVLYGFENAFLKKKISSSLDNYISGFVSKDSIEQSVSIQIDSISKPLIISSALIERDKRIPSSKITINGIQKKNNAGTSQDLVDFFNREYKDILQSKLIRVNSKFDKILLKGIESGKNAIFIPRSDNNLFQKLGIIESEQILDKLLNSDTGAELSSEKLAKEEQFIFGKKAVFFLPKDITDVSTGLAKFDNTYREMKLDAVESVEGSSKVIRTFKVVPPPKSTDFGVDVRLLTVEDAKEEIPLNVTLGIINTVNVKGIEVNTYSITKNRPTLPEISINRSFEIILSYEKGSKNITYPITSSGVQKIPIQLGLEKVTFVANNHTVFLKNAQFHFLKENTSSDEKVNMQKVQNDKLSRENKNEPSKKTKQQRIFPNLIQEAENTKLLVDGVKVEREASKGIQDILDGVSLDILKKSDMPIKVEIEKDIEEAKKQISLFVEEYNSLIQLYRGFSTVDKDSGIGEFNQRKAKNGILVANSMIRTLMFGVQRKISEVYPALEEPFLNILSKIGISTGKVGSNWGDISAGYLELDGDKLEDVLKKHPKSIKDFFAIDTNYDNQLDHGFAYSMNQYLNPYIRSIDGIIQTYIKNNEEVVKRLKKNAAKVEKGAQAERKKLEQQFSRMESLVQKYKSTESYLKNFQKN